MSQSKDLIGIASVLLGVIALGLAIIPNAIFDVPPPWPNEPAAKPQEIMQGGKTFEWKGAKVTIGGTTAVVYPPPPPPVPASAKAFFIATTVLALLGIAAGLISAWRDKSYMLGGPAVALCSAALLWHYIMIGVAVGIAFIFIVIMLSSIAGSLPT